MQGIKRRAANVEDARGLSGSQAHEYGAEHKGRYDFRRTKIRVQKISSNKTPATPEMEALK